MTSAQGMTLRRFGLAIEAACMIGLLSLSRGNFTIWNGFPFDPSVTLTAGLAVGVLMWAVGTWTIYASRRKDGGE
jgi:hypothetical protein